MGMAIYTNYVGPTDRRGSRVKASLPAPHKGSVTLEWNPALDSVANHANALRALVNKLNANAELHGAGSAWSGEWHCADAGKQYVWVRSGKGESVQVS